MRSKSEGISMKYTWIICLLLFIVIAPVQAQTEANRIVIDADAPGTPINPLLLGNNLQWRDDGDGLLLPQSLDFDPAALGMVEALAPTVLRYPGGSLADTFDWRLSLGGIDERGSIDGQPVTFGLVEFLTLCQRVGAEPLYTVNVVTSTPEDAAALITALWDFPPELPRIRYWEIGNEPYLKNDANPALDLTPEVYANRANAFIRAMKAVDPTIQVGIPLQSDHWGNLEATPYQGYSRIVLETITEPFDFVAIHDAYRPVALTGPRDDAALFAALMAAPRAVHEDMQGIRALLVDYGYGDLPLALTEYNALFSINAEPLDSYITSLASGLYVADLLHLLASQEDMLMAEFWSLRGNWYLGAISYQNQPRPAYTVLQMYREKLRGERLPVAVSGGTFSSPEVGFVPAYADIPVIGAFVVRDAGALRVFAVNRSLTAQPVDLVVDHAAGRFSSGMVYTFTGDQPFAGAVPFTESAPIAWQQSPLEIPPFPFHAELPPHSLTIFEFLPAG